MRDKVLSFFQRPLVSALLFQAVSLLVGVASVPVLLIFLSDRDFLAWILIATFGACTIQIEQGIQIVAARRLGLFWHCQDSKNFLSELEKARRRFRVFSLFVIVGLGAIGFFYFGLLIDVPLSSDWPIVWCLFILTYGMNYWFGSNSVILLATANTSQFNLTNAFTRSVNLVLTIIFLEKGFSLLGLALSFFISVNLSVFLLRRWANQVVTAIDKRTFSVKRENKLNKDSHHTVIYTFFTLSNFFVYKGTFLIIPMFISSSQISVYGLSLQLVAIVYTIAIVPTQVWLSKLMTAVLDKDKHRVFLQIVYSLLFGLLIFSASFSFLHFFGNAALNLIGSSVALPPSWILALIFLAFAIESIIFILVNLLIILNVTKFLWKYFACVWGAFATSVLIAQFWENATDIVFPFLVLPLIIQTFIALPTAVFYTFQALTSEN